MRDLSSLCSPMSQTHQIWPEKMRQNPSFVLKSIGSYHLDASRLTGRKTCITIMPWACYVKWTGAQGRGATPCPLCCQKGLGVGITKGEWCHHYGSSCFIYIFLAFNQNCILFWADIVIGISSFLCRKTVIQLQEPLNCDELFFYNRFEHKNAISHCANAWKAQLLALQLLVSAIMLHVGYYWWCCNDDERFLPSSSSRRMNTLFLNSSVGQCSCPAAEADLGL